MNKKIKIDDNGGCGCAMVIIAIGILYVLIALAKYIETLNP